MSSLDKERGRRICARLRRYAHAIDCARLADQLKDPYFEQALCLAEGHAAAIARLTGLAKTRGRDVEAMTRGLIRWRCLQIKQMAIARRMSGEARREAVKLARWYHGMAMERLRWLESKLDRPPARVRVWRNGRLVPVQLAETRP